MERLGAMEAVQRDRWEDMEEPQEKVEMVAAILAARQLVLIRLLLITLMACSKDGDLEMR